MTIITSVERHSTVANFELISNGVSYMVGQIAQSFIILNSAQPVLPQGRAELIIRSEGKDPVHRQIEVIGPDAERPERIVIRRQ